MSELYEQRIDAMKARESAEASAWGKTINAAFTELAQNRRNTDRLAAYKRKRAAWKETGYAI